MAFMLLMEAYIVSGAWVDQAYLNYIICFAFWSAYTLVHAMIWPFIVSATKVHSMYLGPKIFDHLLRRAPAEF